MWVMKAALPNIQSNEEAIDTVMEAIAAAGYKPGFTNHHCDGCSQQRAVGQ